MATLTKDVEFGDSDVDRQGGPAYCSPWVAKRNWYALTTELIIKVSGKHIM